MKLGVRFDDEVPFRGDTIADDVVGVVYAVRRPSGERPAVAFLMDGTFTQEEIRAAIRELTRFVRGGMIGD